MLFNYGTLASLAFTFATLGNGHLIMKTPVPFGVSTLNNSPLNNAKPGTSGSDYPCKQRQGVYDITKMNHIAVNSPQELSFIGSASHGGGTCQIAMTKDHEPTANSTFKIIQVFEGGCPIDSDGNGGTHPFTFTIPKGFPNGVVTLTWIWYNRIGDREIYMNCAPVTVTGGADNDDVFDSLPNIYLINLPTEECQSTADGGSDSVIIPHPGQYIMKEPASQSLATASGPSCAASAAAMTEGVKGYKAAPVITTNGAAYHAPAGAPTGSASAGASGSASGMASGSAAPSGGASGSAAAPSGSAAAPSGSAPAAGSSAAGSGLISMSTAPSGSAAAPSGAASGSAAPSAAPSRSAPAGSAAPSASSPAGSATPSAAPSASASASASGGVVVPSAAPSGSAAAPSGAAPSGSASSCSSAGGSMSCSSDGKQFGVCSNGATVWRPVAPGTTCSGGQITKRGALRNVHVRRHVQKGVRHAAFDFFGADF